MILYYSLFSCRRGNMQRPGNKFCEFCLLKIKTQNIYTFTYINQIHSDLNFIQHNHNILLHNHCVPWSCSQYIHSYPHHSLICLFSRKFIQEMIKMELNKHNTDKCELILFSISHPYRFIFSISEDLTFIEMKIICL